MSQRLSRKEIKRDEFMESMADAFEWVRENTKTLLGIAGAALIALILVVIYLGYAERREQKADNALARALRVYQAEIDPVAANPDDESAPTFANADARSRRAQELFSEVVDDFGRSAAGGVATVYLGQIAAQDGDLESARTYWQSFLARDGDHALAIEVQVNLMALDRAQGRGDELVTELRAQLSGPNTGPPPDLLWYQLGVTLEALDRQTEANEAFQRLVDEYPQSAYAPAARERTGAAQAPIFGG